MRVLFTTWNSPSHLYPLVPLARAMQRQGHEVRIAAPPACSAQIAAAGLRPQPVGLDIDVSATSARGVLSSWHTQPHWPEGWAEAPERLGPAEVGILRALGGKQVRIADAMLEDTLHAAYEYDPGLVVHDAGTYVGRVVGTALGVPTVSHLWGSPAVMRLELQALRGDTLPGYAELFRRAHLEPAPDSSMWLDPCPPSLHVPSPTPRTPIRPVPYNGSGSAPDWVHEPPRGRRVLLTWGVTSAKLHEELPPLLRRALEAALREADEVVLALHPSHLALVRSAFGGGLPDHVRPVSGAPLRDLLTGCAAIIHQGGGGTTLTSLAAGVPQLIVSPRPEQMVTGAQLARAGAARHLVGNDLATTEDPASVLAAELGTLYGSDYRDAARGLADEIATMPAPDEVAAALVAMAGGTHRGDSLFAA